MRDSFEDDNEKSDAYPYEDANSPVARRSGVDLSSAKKRFASEYGTDNEVERAAVQ